MATAYQPAPRKHLVPTALRAPLEARTWREFLHLLLNLPMGIIGFVYTVTMFSVGAGLLVTFIGVPILALALAGCRGFGVVERARARVLLRLDVPEPAPLRPKNGGPMSWFGAVFKSGVSWRHMIHTLLLMPWGIFTFTVAITLWSLGWSMVTYPLWQWVFPRYADQPGIQLYGDASGNNNWYLDSPLEIAAYAGAGALIWMATPWVIRGLAAVDGLMIRGLLSPSALAERVQELESDRGTVVDTAAADLRRIERDLHDGAQARLVALAMDLGLAKEKLLEDPNAAAKMVDEAHGEVKLALQELRDLARGIHPAVLTDRGLDAALSSVAARCTVPVRVTVDLPTRPAPACEGIAYFVVSELLTNISKHSGASSANIDVWRSEDRLMLQVWDNGRGGADPEKGSGLAGLGERLDAVDGLLVADSPPGGPTVVTAEIPWRNREIPA